MNSANSTSRARTLAVATIPGASLAQTCLNNSNKNLVKNGGFELGSGTNVTDWNVEWPPSVDSYVYEDTSNPHSGSQDLAMGTIQASNDIVQEIKGTSRGRVYTVCFWLYSSPNQTAGVTTFEVLWNNVPAMSMFNNAPFGYQYFAVNVIAQGNGLDYLRFRERNDQGFFFLDDVAVQECTGCGLNEASKSKTK